MKTRVRCLINLGGASKAVIIYAGELGWLAGDEIRWDKHPEEPMKLPSPPHNIGMREGYHYEVVNGYGDPD